VRSFLRATLGSARISTTIYLRFFNWTGFALRFLPPLLSLSVAWILYNVVYHQSTSASFKNATNSSDYFSFVVVGSAFFVYVVSTMFTLGRTMYWDRAQGVLETVFLTPSSVLGYITGRMLSAFSMSTLDLLVLFGIGYALGFQVTSFNPIVFFASLALMIASLFGLGLIVNTITLIFRDRVNTANTLTTLILVFSGVVAPLGLMPEWAQRIGAVIPFTYAISLMRASLLSNEVVNYGDLWYLAGLTLVFLLTGYVLLLATVKAIRKQALYSHI
jgi:ABC-2 type transport system permease protein